MRAVALSIMRAFVILITLGGLVVTAASAYVIWHDGGYKALAVGAGMLILSTVIRLTVNLWPRRRAATKTGPGVE